LKNESLKTPKIRHPNTESINNSKTFLSNDAVLIDEICRKPHQKESRVFWRPPDVSLDCTEGSGEIYRRES
jgi:hypothetical protein